MKKKQSKLSILWSFMKGNRLIYIAAILCIGAATLFSYLRPLIIKNTIDSIIGNSPMVLPQKLMEIYNAIGGQSYLVKNLWISALLFVMLTLFHGLFMYMKGKLSAKASETIAKNIRDRLYNHLQLLPFNYHVKAQTGDLIQRCTSDVEQIRRFLSVQFVEIGRALFMVGFAVPIMLSLNATLTLVSMTVIPIIFAFAVVFFIKIQKAFLLSDEAEGALSATLQENLTGVRVVKAFGRERHEIDKFDKKNSTYRNLTYRLIKLLAYYWSISDFVCLTQIGAVLIYGVFLAVGNTISIGTLLVFITYEGMILWPVRQMGRILTDMGKTLVSVGRINEILNEPVEELEKNGLTPAITGDITFEKVGFSYENSRKILKNVSFSVKEGQTIAILGPTGSGKSSLVNLLPRLYDYQEGSIKINGMELKNIDKKWIRENIGMVMQEPFLYSKSIKDNITMSFSEALEEQVHEASSTASIHENILGFEKGYDTLVGEKGVSLSGGQKQRVAIARALIKTTPILILDDALSAVDTQTDEKIRNALAKKLGKTTTFIIAHRINTIQNADLILVLENGEITQVGTHEELLLQEGLYKRIWDIQNSLETEEVS